MQQCWFITGISSGIGWELTTRLLAAGHRVAGTTRKMGPLDELIARYPEALRLYSLDVTDSSAVHRVVAAAFSDLKRIDVVVNNAGYGLFGAAEEASSEQIRHQIDTNVLGSIEVIRAAVPRFRAQGGGRILQISSEGGQLAYPNFSLYHTSKWAIEGFVAATSQDVAPFGIQFTIVEPGPAKTNFRGGLVMPLSMQVYDDTPAGDMRRRIAADAFKLRGDAGKMADRIIESTLVEPAPRRLVLGGSSYESIRHELLRRIDELDAQKDIAYSTDQPA